MFIDTLFNFNKSWRSENNDYSKKDNLVAVKIKVSLSDLTYAGTASRVKIVSAVYDSTGDDTAE